MPTHLGPSKKRRPGPAPARTEPRKRLIDWRKRVGYPIAIAGLLLFLVGNIGARTGIVLLPFDPHHVVAQVGGALLGILGLVWATR